jgi:hypothetical protein
MFMAPLVLVLVPVAIVLWPPTMVLLGLAWLLLWPFAALARRSGGTGLPKAHDTIGRWFRTLLTPWNYFDEPDDKEDDPS